MAMHKCPHCDNVIELEVRFTKAPAMQSQQPADSGTDAEWALESLLGAIDDKSLGGKAANFVAETRERFKKYGSRTTMSDRQMKWLRSIAEEQKNNGW